MAIKLWQNILNKNCKYNTLNVTVAQSSLIYIPDIERFTNQGSVISTPGTIY